jgi:hypothetical protein
MFRNLVFEDFKDRVGGIFELCDEARAPSLALTLVEATPLPARYGLEGVRPPFSLMFSGSDARPLPQGLYSLRHDEMGEITILLVPVGREAQSFTYQSLFN